MSALPDLLRPGDLIVVNNTQGLPGATAGPSRCPAAALVECLLIRHLESGSDLGQIQGQTRSDLTPFLQGNFDQGQTRV